MTTFTVLFYHGSKSCTAKAYSGIAGLVRAQLDMLMHLYEDNYCVVSDGKHLTYVHSIRQLPAC